MQFELIVPVAQSVASPILLRMTLRFHVAPEVETTSECSNAGLLKNKLKPLVCYNLTSVGLGPVLSLFGNGERNGNLGWSFCLIQLRIPC